VSHDSPLIPPVLLGLVQSTHPAPENPPLPHAVLVLPVRQSLLPSQQPVHDSLQTQAPAAEHDCSPDVVVHVAQMAPLIPQWSVFEALHTPVLPEAVQQPVHEVLSQTH